MESHTAGRRQPSEYSGPQGMAETAIMRQKRPVSYQFVCACGRKLPEAKVEALARWRTLEDT